MYRGGIGNDSSLGTYSLTRGSTWWWYMKFFLTWTRNRFLLHHHPAMSLDKVLVETCLILQEELLVLLLVLDDPGLRWMFSDVDLLQRFWLFHLRLGKMFHHFAALTLPLHGPFGRGVQMRPPAPNSSMSATTMSPFQFLPAYNTQPRNIPGKTSRPNWCSRDRSLAEIGWYSTIAPNGITGPLNGISNRLS